MRATRRANRKRRYGSWPSGTQPSRANATLPSRRDEALVVDARPDCGRYVHLIAQRVPHVSGRGTALKGLLRGERVEARQRELLAQRGRVRLTEGLDDRQTKFRQTHVQLLLDRPQKLGDGVREVRHDGHPTQGPGVDQSLCHLKTHGNLAKNGRHRNIKGV